VKRRPLPIPPHFSADRVADVWRVAYAQRARDAALWAAQHGIGPAATDEPQVALLLVDCQNTFCIPGFELFVGGRSGTGAVDDNVRLCEFIYRNLATISQIVVTMDTHRAMQIFHPVFWVDKNGEHPTGGQTVIALDDVQRGVWRVNPAVASGLDQFDYEYLSRHAHHYATSLTAGGKYPLLIWPYHAMLGGIGHALVSAVEEAAFFHGIARGRQTRFEIKGDHPLTEHYSVLGAEVMTGPGGEAIARKNTALIEWLLDFDAVVIAGQAQSHCVAWTLHDLLAEVESRDPALAKRIYLLEDCTSPVVIRDVVDFTDQAAEAFQRFEAAGMHLVKSNDPLAGWLGTTG
jgi:nicotinamidase-related amidase